MKQDTNPQFQDTELITRLVSEVGYPQAGAGIVASKLTASTQS